MNGDAIKDIDETVDRLNSSMEKSTKKKLAISWTGCELSVMLSMGG
jgi:hypothetical protein